MVATETHEAHARKTTIEQLVFMALGLGTPPTWPGILMCQDHLPTRTQNPVFMCTPIHRLFIQFSFLQRLVLQQIDSPIPQFLYRGLESTLIFSLRACVCVSVCYVFLY